MTRTLPPGWSNRWPLPSARRAGLGLIGYRLENQSWPEWPEDAAARAVSLAVPAYSAAAYAPDATTTNEWPESAPARLVGVMVPYF